MGILLDTLRSFPNNFPNLKLHSEFLMLTRWTKNLEKCLDVQEESKMKLTWEHPNNDENWTDFGFSQKSEFLAEETLELSFIVENEELDKSVSEKSTTLVFVNKKEWEDFCQYIEICKEIVEKQNWV